MHRFCIFGLDSTAVSVRRKDFHPSLIFTFFFFKNLRPCFNLKVLDDLLNVNFSELPASPVVAVQWRETSVTTRGSVTRDDRPNGRAVVVSEGVVSKVSSATAG